MERWSKKGWASTCRSTPNRYLLASVTLLVIFFLFVFHDSLSSCRRSRMSVQPHFQDFGHKRLMDYLDLCSVTGTVPKIVWTFWFGSGMSPKRQCALNNMGEILNVPVVLLDARNMSGFLTWPVHPAVQYLSDNHKSDYFRIYFLLHYGGGYSDIKHMVESWEKYYEDFKDSNIWIVGVPEQKGGVAVRPGVEYPSEYYKSMISNGFMIARPNNRLLQEVHDIQHALLDKHIHALEQHPAPEPRCCQKPKGGYPLRWAELMGENMAFVAGKYVGHLSPIMKLPSLSDYI